MCNIIDDIYQKALRSIVALKPKGKCICELDFGESCERCDTNSRIAKAVRIAEAALSKVSKNNLTTTKGE